MGLSTLLVRLFGEGDEEPSHNIPTELEPTTVSFLKKITLLNSVFFISDNKNIKLGKAGRKRWLGIRPRTRPVAMNPVDHPMGGGEGKASGGHPRSKKGIPAKGYRTRSKKKASSKFIIERRKK